MDIQITDDGSQATVALGGHLDTNTAPELTAKLEGVFEQSNHIVFDMANLEYLSSAGIRVLVAALKKVSAAGGSMKIVNCCEDVQGVFEITGLVDVLNVQ